MIYLSFEQIMELHDVLLEKFGGLSGIRDRGSLESTLTMPMTAVFGEERYKTIYDKAAAYLFYIARNHPFLDGNKRTASAAALAFLRSNGQSPQYETDAFLEFVVLIAEGSADLNAASIYFKNICS
jgi:death on curing protein